MTLDRYSRQIVLPQVGVNGQALLRDSSALIVGLGGLGSAAALYLAGAGLGRLVLSDFDRVELSNLQRQILYREVDVGRDKLAAARDALHALAAPCEIEALPGPLDGAALGRAVAGVDVVLDCSDNFPTRFALNAACVAQRRPLISGAAIRFEGQCAVFDLRRGGACYACLYAETGAPQEACEDAGVLGPVVGMIGSLQALAAVELLLGLDPGAGVLHVFDALQLRFRRMTIARDPQCAVCARPP